MTSLDDHCFLASDCPLCVLPLIASSTPPITPHPPRPRPGLVSVPRRRRLRTNTCTGSVRRSVPSSLADLLPAHHPAAGMVTAGAPTQPVPTTLAPEVITRACAWRRGSGSGPASEVSVWTVSGTRQNTPSPSMLVVGCTRRCCNTQFVDQMC